MIEGFDADHYPDLGLFLATHQPLAEEFQRCYENGLQEMHMPAHVFKDWSKEVSSNPTSISPKDSRGTFCRETFHN
jgi:hypothetical protein